MDQMINNDDCDEYKYLIKNSMIFFHWNFDEFISTNMIDLMNEKKISLMYFFSCELMSERCTDEKYITNVEEIIKENKLSNEIRNHWTLNKSGIPHTHRHQKKKNIDRTI